MKAELEGLVRGLEGANEVYSAPDAADPAALAGDPPIEAEQSLHGDGNEELEIQAPAFIGPVLPEQILHGDHSPVERIASTTKRRLLSCMFDKTTVAVRSGLYRNLTPMHAAGAPSTFPIAQENHEVEIVGKKSDRGQAGPRLKFYAMEPSFADLAQKDKEFGKYVMLDEDGRGCVNFRNPDATRSILSLLLPSKSWSNYL